MLSRLLVGSLAATAALLGACGSRALPASFVDAGVDGSRTLGACAAGCGRVDVDGDGYPPPPCGEDCDDLDPLVHPGADDVLGDGLDANCDGVDGIDVDGDGHAPAELGGGDCDDALATVRPGANDGEGWRIEPAKLGLFNVLRLDAWGRPHVAVGWKEPGPLPDCSDSSELAVSSWRAGDWTRIPVVEGGCISTGYGLATYRRELLLSFAAGAQEPGGRDVMVGVGPEPAWDLRTVDHLGRDVDGISDLCGGLDLAYAVPYVDGLDQAELRVRGSGPNDEPMVIDHLRSFSPRLARAPDGTLWLAYGVRTAAGENPDGDSEVRVASDAGGEWAVDVVAVPRCVGCLHHVDVTVDTGGSPHIVYGSDEGVTHAYRLEGRWERELVAGPNGGLSVDPATLAVRADSMGSLHVVYFAIEPDSTPDAPRWRVWYATNRSGAWQAEPLGPVIVQVDNGESGWPSMEIDARDQVHVVWSSSRDEDGPLVGAGTLGRYAILSRPNDGIDQNCDGVDGVDADGDGHASRETGGDDVDDDNPAR